MVEKGPKDVGYLIGGLLYGKKLTNQLLSRLFERFLMGTVVAIKYICTFLHLTMKHFFFFFFRNYSFHGIQFV